MVRLGPRLVRRPDRPRQGHGLLRLATRRSSPADADRLARIVGPAQQYLAAKPQRVAAVELTARLEDGHVAAARAVIVVLAQDTEPYRVLIFTPVRSAKLM